MVNNGIVYSSYGRNSRVYVSFNIAEIDILNNKWKIDWEAGIVIEKNDYWYSNAVKINSIYIDGGTSLGSGTYSNVKGTGTYTKISGSKWIDANIDGSKTISVSINGWFYSYGNVSGSNTFALTNIPRQATLLSAPDFNDEENPTITYSNPAGNAVRALQACISWTGADDIAYRDIETNKDSYTFELTDEERTKIRQAVKNGTTMSVKFYVATWFDVKNPYFSTLDKKVTIINCEPDLDPTIIDDGNVSQNLLNNPFKFIRYFNYPIITFNATAKKGAYIVNKSVTCGTQTKNIDGDFTNLENVDSNVFTISATDSRGITVSKDVSVDMIPYVNLTCNTEINNELGTDTTNSKIRLTVKGDFYTGKFVAVNNNLIVEYRYKSNDDTDYPEKWTDISSQATLYADTNKYSIATVIEGIDYTKTYMLQVRARDRVNTSGVYARDEHIKIRPVFDWSEDDFNFNVPVTIQKKEVRTYGTDRIARAYTQETEISYEANSYIKLFRSNSPDDLYNQDIATFQENGLITINKDMLALVNVHIVSYNNHQDNRSWIKLINYNSNDPSKSWRFTDCINYGLYTTSNITIMLKLSAGDIIGLQTAHPMTINTSGLVGSYIEIIEL